MLCVAETVVCRWRMFHQSPAGTAIVCHLIPFSLDFEKWRTEGSDEGRKRLWQFLNGEEIYREKNYVEFIVPDRDCDIRGFSAEDPSEKLLDFLFFKNPRVQIDSSVYDLDISVQMVPDSARLVRTFRGCAKRFGNYRKFTIAFSTKVRLNKPLRDISQTELAKHYWIWRPNEKYKAEKSMRALKAFVADMDGVYVSRQGHFIAPAPQTFEDRLTIFKSELVAECSLDLVSLIKLGAEFATTAEAREIFAQGTGKFHIMEYGHVVHINRTFGSGLRSCSAYISILLPRTDKYPWAFVENVHKGIMEYDAYKGRWIANGKVSDVLIKFGEFQVSVVAPTSRHASHETILYGTVLFLNDVIKFLNAMVDFVKLLMGDVRNVAINGSKAMGINLGNIIIDKVMLSPMDYMDCEIKAISDFARQYVTGE